MRVTPTYRLTILNYPMPIERKLTEYYLDFRKKQYSEIFKKKLPIKKQKEIKDFIIKYIKDDDKYLSLISDEGNNISFIIADKGEDDGEDAIVCQMIIENRYINNQRINKEIKKIKDFFTEKFKYRKIILIAYPLQQNLIRQYKQLGYEFTGNTYIGNVKDSLKYYKSKIFSPHKGIKIRNSLKNDIPKILKLEKLSHGADKTSRNRDVTSKQKKAYQKMLENSVRENAAFLIEKNKVLIGYLWVALFSKDKTFIGDVAVHPSYWGKGLANILYNQAFQFMVKKGIKSYMGTSSTTAVMKLAEKLNRKIIYSSYYVNV